MVVKQSSLALALGVVTVCTGSVLGVTTQDVIAASEKPNIVVFYVDDNSPHPTWLWSNRQRTPNLARFVNQGVTFEEATAVTSLCAPGRAATLTGRYGHNNGVTNNYPVKFNAKQTFAPKLRAEGYDTKFTGKFLNKLKDLVKNRKEAMRRYAVGWKQFDILGSGQGKFYDYPLWTRKWSKRFGSRPKDHSTRVITSRVVRHIKNTPKSKPVFEFVSIYNGHVPNTPMRQFVNDLACRNVRAWKGPAYNEEDVSDKPIRIQELPRHPENSYDLRTRCEEFMTVDWSVGEIMKALKKTGRYKNTLMVFTSDNGWGMGDHRKIGKGLPYTNPVIMYMLWPAVMHGNPRTVTERVQNIDLAPTFCAIAGCSLPRADGESLLPLIKGKSNRLNRRFVFEEMPYSVGETPFGIGVRTTLSFSEKDFWVYTKYSTGERELYDLVQDPWQLENLAGKPGYKDIEQILDGMVQKVLDRDRVRFMD